MKKKEKAYSIALVSIFIILFLIFVSSTASGLSEKNSHNFNALEITGGAGDPSDDKVVLNELSTEENNIATESIQAAAPKIIEIRIPTNKSEKWSPVIYGNRILWTDFPTDVDTANIHMYDLSTSKETQITNSGSAYFTAIYGNRVVYDDYRNGNFDIYMYDLSTKKETQITTNESDEYSDAFYGNKIIWSVSLDNSGDLPISNIYIYDLSTKKETQITTSGSAHGSDIYGNIIVWCDQRNGQSDIYMYDLSTKKEIQITTSGSACDPAIYEDRIVWVDDRNGNPDIYMYDFSTKKEKRITTNSSDQYTPAIYGNRIVWDDRRNENQDIYMYDLSTSTETRITTDESNHFSPAIYDDKVVWAGSYSNGNRDIYMGTLVYSPVAAFSASPTSGKAPLTVAFTDKSTGIPTSWKWTFGDGTFSTVQNPAHKYSKVGKYTVSLTVKNSAGSNTVAKTDYIKVIAKPVASFSASPTSGKAPLNVKFTDKSTGTPTKWTWTFGDGEKSSDKNPKHQYLQEGKYKVTLTVTNDAGSRTATKTNYITVTTNTRPGTTNTIPETTNTIPETTSTRSGI